MSEVTPLQWFERQRGAARQQIHVRQLSADDIEREIAALETNLRHASTPFFEADHRGAIAGCLDVLFERGL